ncbi:MAG: hypothetical protein KN64_08500 [Sulfurovum sp. AS07-7]|nr:MAG: hypothetical protein KN64_08500 [Sulfurovum sp. AS07-7]MBD3795897.1 TerB family tellurite resistance protein [Campylobacterota bacterium]MBD3839976.1 TerB family tellurite resistance protein [Campylobacterota bacterium]
MGFFDKFSSSVELTPTIALSASMIYMMSSDGDIADEEMNYLFVTLNALGDVRNIVDNAVKFAKKNSLEEFISKANTLLNNEQKMVIVSNLADLLLSDGSAEPEEEALFFRFVDGWSVAHDDVEVIINAIGIKNNYSILA